MLAIWGVWALLLALGLVALGLVMVGQFRDESRHVDGARSFFRGQARAWSIAGLGLVLVDAVVLVLWLRSMS